MLKAIIFDYDGVIVDSFPSVHEVYQTLCDELGFQCPKSIEEFRTQYGYSAKELCKNLGIPEHLSQKVRDIFAREIIAKNPPLYGGITNVLKELHARYKLFLVTSNLKQEALQKTRIYNLDGYFDYIGGMEKTSEKFNKKEEIAAVLKKEGIELCEVIYIGDRNIDYDIAKETGIDKIILVDYGWGFDRNYTPNIQKDSITQPHQLLSAIQEYEKTD